MIRIKISFGIIISIIVLGVSGFFVLRHETYELIGLIDETKSYSDSANTEEALKSADKLLKKWDKFHTYASVFINNDKISDVQESVSRLKALIETGNDELNAEYDSAKSTLKWIVESEIPRWTNIL
ncbi:MAG: DUF4363 family protein [Oscillospiraceae bacterium]|nr:DUF4363 family protein [Oscillospiraceae bacterium]